MALTTHGNHCEEHFPVLNTAKCLSSSNTSISNLRSTSSLFSTLSHVPSQSFSWSLAYSTSQGKQNADKIPEEWTQAKALNQAVWLSFLVKNLQKENKAVNLRTKQACLLLPFTQTYLGNQVFPMNLNGRQGCPVLSTLGGHLDSASSRTFLIALGICLASDQTYPSPL